MDWELVTSSGQSYVLQDGATIGRSLEATITLQDSKASRLHAQFRIRGETVMMRDLNSTNGTYVNQIRITAPITLKAKDHIRIGDTKLMLRPVLRRWDPLPASPAPAHLNRAAADDWSQPQFHSPPHQEVAQRPPLATCPSCGQGNTVRSAAIAGLEAPKPPSDTAIKVVRIIFWAYAAIYGLMMLLMLGTFLFGGVVSLLDPTGFTTGAVGITGIASVCFFVPALAVGIGIPWLIKRYIERRYRERYDQWGKAKSKWDRLYYCNQCAGVFLPGQRRLVPVEQMESFLFEISPRAVDF
jgi:pSer/pThr/pTyr-binding forkhead associated (FHA) protein